MQVQSPGDETVPEDDLPRHRPGAHRYPCVGFAQRNREDLPMQLWQPSLQQQSTPEGTGVSLTFVFFLKRRSRAADRSGYPCSA